MKRKWLHTGAKVGLSLLLVLVLSRFVDGPATLATLGAMHLAPYALSMVCTLATVVVLAAKYHWLIRRTEIARSLRFLIGLNLVMRFYALFVPSTVGQEAIRWYRVTGNRQGRAFFLACMLLESLTFLLVVVVTALVGLWLAGPNVEVLRTALVAPGTALAIAGATILGGLSSHRIRLAVESWAARHAHGESGWWNRVRDLVRAMDLGHFSAPVLGLVLLGAVVWQVLFTLRILLLFRALDVPLGLDAAAWTGALVMLLQAIPISLAGIGIREAAYAAFFPLYGLPEENGVAVALLFFSQMLLLSMLGGMIELFWNRRPPE